MALAYVNQRLTTVLSSSQFLHRGLEKVYLGLSSTAIPISLVGRCRRLLDDIESATKPEDTDFLGNGYKRSGAVYSLDVDGVERITFEWRNQQAADINYV